MTICGDGLLMMKHEVHFHNQSKIVKKVLHQHCEIVSIPLSQMSSFSAFSNCFYFTSVSAIHRINTRRVSLKKSLQILLYQSNTLQKNIENVGDEIWNFLLLEIKHLPFIL